MVFSKTNQPFPSLRIAPIRVSKDLRLCSEGKEGEEKRSESVFHLCSWLDGYAMRLDKALQALYFFCLQLHLLAQGV